MIRRTEVLRLKGEGGRWCLIRCAIMVDGVPATVGIHYPEIVVDVLEKDLVGQPWRDCEYERGGRGPRLADPDLARPVGIDRPELVVGALEVDAGLQTDRR